MHSLKGLLDGLGTQVVSLIVLMLTSLIFIPPVIATKEKLEGHLVLLFRSIASVVAPILQDAVLNLRKWVTREYHH